MSNERQTPVFVEVVGIMVIVLLAAFVLIASGVTIHNSVRLNHLEQRMVEVGK